MSARVAGLVLGAFSLCVVVTGAGGLGAEAAALFELSALAAALIAASLPAVPGPPRAAAFGLLAAAAALLSAARAPFVFASLDRWAAWGSALLLAWALSRLERAAPDEATGRRDTGLVLTAAAAAALALQLLAELGLPLRGAAELVETGRRLGSFASPNHLSGLLVLLAAALLPWVGLRGGRARLAAGLAGGSALLAVASGSRIAPAAVLAGLVAWLAARAAWKRRLPRAWVLGGLVLFVLLAGATARVVVARLSEQDAWSRPRIWAAVAPAALERPVLGLGPGSFAHAHERYNFPAADRLGRYGKQPSTPHGEWLRLPIELGFAGVLLLGLLVAARLRAPPRGERLRAVLPLAASVAALAAVHDLFHAPALAAWTAAAFVAATERRGTAAPRAAPLSLREPQRLLAAALVAAVGVAGLVVRPALGDRAARAGRVDEALRLSPHHAGYWLAAGSRGWPIAGGPERAAGAALCFEEAARLSSRSAEPAKRLARVLSAATFELVPDEASREAASRAWAEASARSPHDAFLLAEHAAFLLQTGAPARARALSERALELEPLFSDAALLALLAGRELEGPGGAAAERRRAAALLEGLPERRERVSGDYERRLLEPAPRLLEASGLRGSSAR